ncbi:50S ribosomal protein L10 [Bacillus sp. RO2]|nr:50S ribosomal protein L10 [Bacillus sp. RO2]
MLKKCLPKKKNQMKVLIKEMMKRALEKLQIIKRIKALLIKQIHLLFHNRNPKKKI